LFPDLIRAVLDHSILKRAQDKGLLDVHVRNLRDYTVDRHQVADDAPYGGGAGMVLKAEPMFLAVDALRQERANDPNGLRLILPSPQGRLLTQSLAEELSREECTLVFLCGHYEGIDERVRLGLHPEEISIGDYVLTGGELPTLVMIDTVARLIPGVVGDPASIQEDSFSLALLDYPHYTRPAEVRGLTVPDVLLSGNHEAIRRWRRKAALRNTYLKRPDLLRDRVMTDEDSRLLLEISREHVEQRTTVPCGEEG